MSEKKSKMQVKCTKCGVISDVDVSHLLTTHSEETIRNWGSETYTCHACKKKLYAKVTYFKQTGKYYITENEEVPFTIKDPLYDIFDWLKENRRLPYYCVVEVPEHPHDHPTLILTGCNYE